MSSSDILLTSLWTALALIGSVLFKLGRNSLQRAKEIDRETRLLEFDREHVGRDPIREDQDDIIDDEPPWVPPRRVH